MKKTPLVTLIAVTLTACGGGSGSSNSGSSQLIRHDSPPNSSSQLTTISSTGYSAGHDTENMTGLPVPAFVDANMEWQLQSQLSDDFNYTFTPTNNTTTEFGSGKWYNFYHNQWDGPGATYWQPDHVSVDGNEGKLKLRTSRNPSTSKQDKPGVNTGCISSNATVQYPVFVEASVSMADISLAAAVWLLSPDDTQEIDILEAYAGNGNGNGYFSKLIHLSHHSFIRDPFTDYQPRDRNSWWENTTSNGPLVQGNYDSWGEYSWNNGTRQYLQIGVNWINPWHFEYFINGELVRVLYANAFATKMNDRWEYSYPKVANDDLVIDGYQTVVTHSTDNGDFDFAALKAASNASKVSVIDPYDFQKGKGFHKAADIIINMELQSWWTHDPTDSELLDSSGKTTMLVDWVRVFKPVNK
ncbi:LamG domain-containing protein [Vibrio ulleungensis]|uniref:GH16 domain-containing protein n=1 Tax=Vibrio ulleungensis TaxID=2807619 RepID=A0ABS2HCQ3_9VIBR|nr:hypothetical protein [Vibrio ulleungensis]MBM7035375.1 hypothetical protein [Vibrio ulleungensis]